MLKLSRFSLRQILFTFAVALVALLDPFGISTSTDEASASWLNRLLASGYSDKGQQQVVVVLIDDAYLLRNQTFWPLPYSEQSKLFKRLLAYKPGAVFVDLLYTHDHSRAVPGQAPGMESQLLANVFERYQRQGIALFLANNGTPPDAEDAINTLPRFAEVSTPALVSWSDHGNQYPLAVQTGLGPMETPALKLYREYCRRHDCASLPSDATAAAQRPDIAVQWGLRPSPLQGQAFDLGDCTLPGLADQFLQAVFWKLGNNAQANCTYTLTVSASALEATDSDDQALLRQLLQGKLVLVGARIAGTGDVTLSPLHGKLAGVYVHAMALDNLVNWGMDYYRSTPDLAEFGIAKLDVLDVIELLLLALIAHLKGTLDAPLFNRSFMGQPRRPRIAPLAAWALVFGLLVVLTTALWLKNYTPANVFGLSLLSLTLFSTRFQALFANRT
ncbi:CHASE2 domain-containing protein [Pseudomonas entomophila]|uniref:CHASE2 domain-containing protein n=1 Tax=Pseudomonas entomophila TaxID=312306 RepID=UPI0023D836BF|nr:CHASE2 domain-containing protein [Pseudomonas entomophila]MDF0733509.1 CHASE2 domain-containing protein [Pseudomonas entomophila]